MTDREVQKMLEIARGTPGATEWLPKTEYHPPRVPPQAILDLARKNPLAGAAISLWRNGDLTWEQSLSLLVVQLANRVEDLEQALTLARMGMPVHGNVSGRG